jgi:Tripartite tricarboxylate transporter TctA family
VNSASMVYTVFASLFLGLALMCAIGYFAIRPLVKVLDFPEAVVSAYVLILCFIGALSIRNNVTDLWLIIGFGVLGYGFERLKFPISPLVLGVIGHANFERLAAGRSKLHDIRAIVLRPVDHDAVLATRRSHAHRHLSLPQSSSASRITAGVGSSS